MTLGDSALPAVRNLLGDLDIPAPFLRNAPHNLSPSDPQPTAAFPTDSYRAAAWSFAERRD